MSVLGLGKNYKIKFEKEGEESEIYKTYDAFNNQSQKDICLKVIQQENPDLEEEIDYDLFLKSIEKEGTILKQFDSNHIIKLYNIIVNNKYHILEIENYEMNLYNYMESEPIFEKGEKNVFKKIVIDLVEALNSLKEKGIIHRNIKPKNIYIVKTSEDFDKLSEDNFSLKLANFECAIYTKEVENSKPMGTYMYLAPEIINNLNTMKNQIYGVLV